jgi:hypothetical protein
MALLTTNQATTEGVTPTLVACAAGGDTFYNNGRTFLLFKNGNGAATRTVTIDSLANCNQGVDHNASVTIPISSAGTVVGPFPPARWNNALGIVTMTYSTEADLTVAVVTL